MPRATPKSSTRLTRSRGSKGAARPQNHAVAELMELAVEAAQSRDLPAFLERFAQRATRMLNAKWGAVVVLRGRETDLYQDAASDIHLETPQQVALIRQARQHRREI